MEKIEESIFGGLRFKGEQALLDAGFVLKEGKYQLVTRLEGFPFEVTISSTASGEISGNLIDPDTRDDYVLYRLDAAKGYAIEVREAYKELLRSIKNKVYEEGPLLLQRDRLLSKLYDRYGDSPYVKWAESPDFLVLEHRSNAKWYVLFMIVAKRKVGLEGEGDIAVANIKLDPEEIEWLVTRDGYVRAYHMNKKYWITILLDGRLKDDEILDHIARSHELTLERKK